MAVSTAVNAAPVQFNQVVQIVNVKPGKANTGGFSQLRLANDGVATVDGDGDDDKKPAAPQDDRVITETRVEIVEDDVCDCVEEQVVRRGFPKWALLGLGAIPLLFLFNDNDTPRTRTPTPTPTNGTETPTPTTPTPTTPTPTTPTPTTPTPTTPTPTTPTPTTPTPTTPTPTTPTPMTPTPTPPEPVPEPMTILLFGTGLAGIGIAARKKFGKKEKTEIQS